jgi:hypothetical protein
VTPDPEAWKRFSVNADEPSQLIAVNDKGAETRSYKGTLSLETDTSIQSLRSWIEAHSNPIVPELDAANSAKVLGGPSGKTVVLLVVDPAKSGLEGVSKAALAFIKDAAKAWKKKYEAEDGKGKNVNLVDFAWLNGVEKKGYIKRVCHIQSFFSLRFFPIFSSRY